LSQEAERVYTINLGKVWLSPNNQRAKRAINMIREFASHHMKTEQIKIDQDLSQAVWKRGIRSPPRKIRVKMAKTDEGHVLVSTYEEEKTKTVEEKTNTKDKKKPEKTEEKEIKPKEKPESTAEAKEKPKEETKPKKEEVKPKQVKEMPKEATKPKKEEVKSKKDETKKETKKSTEKKPAKKSK
jgi:large subunit ribosomal protein L31e